MPSPGHNHVKVEAQTKALDRAHKDCKAYHTKMEVRVHATRLIRVTITPHSFLQDPEARAALALKAREGYARRKVIKEVKKIVYMPAASCKLLHASTPQIRCS